MKDVMICETLGVFLYGTLSLVFTLKVVSLKLLLMHILLVLSCLYDSFNSPFVGEMSLLLVPSYVPSKPMHTSSKEMLVCSASL